MSTLYALLVSEVDTQDPFAVALDPTRPLRAQDIMGPWTRDGIVMDDASTRWYGPEVKVWHEPGGSTEQAVNLKAFRILGRPVRGTVLVTADTDDDGRPRPLPADVAKLCREPSRPEVLDVLAQLADARGDHETAARCRDLAGFPPGGITDTEHAALRALVDRLVAQRTAIQDQIDHSRQRIAHGLAARDGVEIGTMIEWDPEAGNGDNYRPRRQVPHEVARIQIHDAGLRVGRPYVLFAWPIKKDGHRYAGDPSEVWWDWRVKTDADG